MTSRGLGAGLWATLVVMAAAVGAEPSWDDLRAAFRSPPAESRPSVFYYWMNGNVTREGITADLEALSHVGIGSVMIFDGGVFIPKGPVDYLGTEWLELVEHATREASRLGIRLGLHNAPGWSSSGGPWITPERSMQQLVWSEVTVDGPRQIEQRLPQPTIKEGFYREAAVVAFPAPPCDATPYHELVERAEVTGGTTPRLVEIATLVDGDFRSHVDLGDGESLTIRLSRPFDVRAVTLFLAPGGSARRFVVESSSDGRTFARVAEVSLQPPRGIECPGIATFDAVAAPIYRITPDRGCRLGEAWLHGGPRIDRWNTKGHFSFQLPKPAEPSPEVSAAQVIDPSCVVELSSHLDEHGTLTWDVPAGPWTILRLGHTSTGQRNISASTAGHGLESDKMSREATDFHVRHTIDAVIGKLGPLAGDAFAHVLIDSYEVEMQNWTAGFPDAFERSAGYGLIPWLPALTGRIVGSVADSDRALFDVRRVQADLVADHYYGRMRELCHDRGLVLYAEPYGPGPFDELQVAGRADVPTTEFWARTPWGDNRVVESVASAAHVYGRPVVAAEAFTAEERTGRWLEHPYALKPVGDQMFANGFNHAFFHRFVHQPNVHARPGMTMGPWGIHFDRTNTWFSECRPWIESLARCQHLLRQGMPVADVLVFVGERTPEVAQERRPVMPTGHRYDLVNAEVLLHRVAVKDGRIVLPEGTRYRLLMVPDDVTGMTPAVLARLEELVTAGMTLLGPRPRTRLTLRGGSEAARAFDRTAEAMWPAAASGPAGHAVGRGRVFSGQGLAEVLQTIGVAADFRWTARRSDAAIVWAHRRIGDADVYFVANRRRREEDVVCEFRVAEREPELWHPESGAVTIPAVVSGREGRVRLPLHLDPAESVFVVFRNPASHSAPRSLVKDGVAVLEAVPFSAAATEATGAFTISAWIKPDTFIRDMPREATTGSVPWRGKHYVLPAADGEASHGAGHAGVAIAAGLNGVYVMERLTRESPAVLVAETPISGWTHLAVTYDQGTPRLYLDGRLVREGLASGRVPHAVIAAASGPGQTHHFEGDHTEIVIEARPLAAAELAARAVAGLPAPVDPPPAEALRRPDGGVELLVWESGRYVLDGMEGEEVSVADAVDVAGPARVTFQPADGGEAPEPISVERFASLSRHPDALVRHFAGTARYSLPVEIPAASLADGRRIVLDLGRVEVLVGVRLNNRELGTLWKPPFRIDVTDAARPGRNELELAVTTLWPNRLIGDEALPPENDYDATGAIGSLPEWYRRGEPKPSGGRRTFTTWKFFAAGDPLLEAGLLGPVRLLFPERRILRAARRVR